MAKITITFESASQLPGGPHVESYEVDEQFAPDFVSALAAHDKHGKKSVNVQKQVPNPSWSADQEDPLNPPQFLSVQQWEDQPRTFEEGLTSWSETNVRDPILNAVNTFRRKKAEAIALAQVNVPEVKPL